VTDKYDKLTLTLTPKNDLLPYPVILVNTIFLNRRKKRKKSDAYFCD